MTKPPWEMGHDEWVRAWTSVYADGLRRAKADPLDPHIAVVGRELTRLLLSNHDKKQEFHLFPYQEAFVGHIILGTHAFIDGLFPTGMGKTYGLGAAIAIRLYIREENDVVIAPTQDQTYIIRDTVEHFYRTGHPALRAALDPDTTKDVIRVRNVDKAWSQLECHTANLNNDGKSLLGLQGRNVILLDERAEIPDDIFYQKIDRITPPQGEKRLLIGITTTHIANHVYDWCDGDLLPRKEACDPAKPLVTRRKGLVFKATWRDGQKAGRAGFDAETIDRKYRELGSDTFGAWYEADFPARGEAFAFPPDLVRAMVL